MGGGVDDRRRVLTDLFPLVLQQRQRSQVTRRIAASSTSNDHTTFYDSCPAHPRTRDLSGAGCVVCERPEGQPMHWWCRWRFERVRAQPGLRCTLFHPHERGGELLEWPPVPHHCHCHRPPPPQTAVRCGQSGPPAARELGGAARTPAAAPSTNLSPAAGVPGAVRQPTMRGRRQPAGSAGQLRGGPLTVTDVDVAHRVKRARPACGVRGRW